MERSSLHNFLNGGSQAKGPRDHNYRLFAPDFPNCRYTTATRRGITQSTIDLFLMARVALFTVSAPHLFLTSTAGGGSDHVHVAITVTYPPHVDTRSHHQFLPTPHRLRQTVLQDRAERDYTASFPRFHQRLRACEDDHSLHAVYTEIAGTVKALWMLKASRKPVRFRPGWSREVDALAKQRTRVTRRQYSAATTEEQRAEANRASRRITKQIKRLMKREQHDRAQDTQRKLANAANRREPAEIARLLCRHARAARESTQLGETLDPADFTEYFADKPQPEHPVPLRRLLHY